LKNVESTTCLDGNKALYVHYTCIVYDLCHVDEIIILYTVDGDAVRDTGSELDRVRCNNV